MSYDFYTVAFFVIYLATWIVGVINMHVMKRFFVLRYPVAAKQIFPGILEKSVSSDFTSFRYMLARGYTAFDDPIFVSRMDLHRMISLITLGLILIGMIAGISFVLAK